MSDTLIYFFCPKCHLATMEGYNNKLGYEMTKCSFCGYTVSQTDHVTNIDKRITKMAKNKGSV